MFIISINHRNAPTELREKYAFSEETVKELLTDPKAKGFGGLVYLNTCNRTELFGTGKCEDAMKLLSDNSGISLADVKETVWAYENENAVMHLFRVTAGMESMVIGEDEILGQIRDAYETSRELAATDYELNVLFQAALATAKRIKTDTRLSKASVSVATIAARKCHYFMEGHKNILLIGASGDTGGKIAKNLVSYGDSTIYATVRRNHFADDGITKIPYEERYKYAKDADIIISCTKCPRYTITYSKLACEELSEKPRLFVDLAVPRDIDEDVLNIEKSELVTMNEIMGLARENNEIKKEEVIHAGEIIEEDVDKILKELAIHDFMRRNGPDLEKDQGFKKFLFKYKEAADHNEFKSFLGVVGRMGRQE